MASRNMSIQRNCPSAREASARGQRAQRALGLVSLKTSHTPTTEIAVHQGSRRLLTKEDQLRMRLKRMQKNTLNTTRLILQEIADTKHRYQAVMVTPTYRPGEGWKPDHMSSFVNNLRQWCSRKGIKFRYVWVAELQEKRLKKFSCEVSEAVHYHLIIWLPKGVTLPKADKRGWWPHGMTRTEPVKASAYGYIAKYASKGISSEFSFPKGCRISGSGGLSEASRNERAWWNCPLWVREKYSISDRPRRAVGGGFVLRSTGEWIPSPYLVVCTPDGIRITKIEAPPSERVTCFQETGRQPEAAPLP